MERLTKRNGEHVSHQDCEGSCEACNGCCGYCATMVDRLAAYENTGLAPDEVATMKNAMMGKSIAEITEFEGISIDRLRELAQADRMIGKEVWAQAKYLNIFQTKQSFIQRTTIQYVSLLKGKDILCHTQTCAFPLNEIGKTVFLTREEAEAARREQG